MTSLIAVTFLAAHCCIVGWCGVMAATPIDRHATQRTQQLLGLLHTLSRDSHKVLFGQQGPTWYGVHGGHAPYSLLPHHGKMEGWKFSHGMANSGHSDELCDVCGIVDDFPAVVGMDLNSLEKNMSDILSHLTRKANSRGAVVTVSWHHKNPVTGGPVYIQDDRGDVLHSVKRLLPGGDHYHRFLSDLDTVASWARSLLDSQGRAIPIILRPFHEAGGDWFWWGLGNSAYNNASDVIRLYQTTVKYLRDEKRVHNLLYAFSPNCAYDWNANALYPGDAYVDIVGVDCYRSQSRDLAAMTTAVQGAVSHARRSGKVAAWTEFGLSSGLETHTFFFTHDILQTELSSPTVMGVAYMMTWTNRCGPEGTCSVHAPYPGHPAASDFRRFYLDSRTMFLSDLKRYASWYFN